MPIESEIKPTAPITQTNIHGDVNTGGGLVNAGQINTSGGDFVASVHHHYPRPATPPRVLPVVDISHFTGRTREIAAMAALLFGSPHTAIVGVWGGPGVGKSALTRFFAEKHGDHFPDGIIGLDARDKSADALAAHFAAVIGEPVDEEHELEPGPIMQARFARRHILLILDNVNRTDARTLVPGGQSSVIVTTRDRELLEHLGIAGEDQITLPYFAAAESSHFLSQLVGQDAVAREADASRTLVALLAGLPLALRIAGATLRSQFLVPHRIARFVEKLRDEQQRLRALHWRDVDELNVEAVFRLSTSLLSADELRLFACLSACVPDDFGLVAVTAAAGLDEDVAATHLSCLVNLALVDYAADIERFRVHTLLHLFARNEAARLDLSLAAQRRHALYFAEYTRQRQTLTASDVHDLAREHAAIVQTAYWMVEQRDLDPAFWHGLRRLLDARGHWQEAIDLMRSYIALADELGTDITRAHFYLHLGRYHMRLADFDAALAAYQRSLAILEAGDDKRSLAMLLNSLGGALQSKGLFDEALAAYRRSLAIRKASGDRWSMAIVLHGLGGALQSKGLFDEALTAYRRSLAIRKASGDQRGMAMVLNSLGGALQGKGLVDAALDAYQRSLTLGEANGDQRHVAMVSHSLGGALQSKGLVDEAIAAYQRSLTISAASSDQRHIAMVLNSLGGALHSKGLLDEALAAYQRSLAIEEATMNQRGIAIALHTLGSALQSKGQFDAALDAYQRCLTLGEACGDQRHIAMLLNTLGGALQSKGQFDVAIEHYQRSLAIGEAIGDQRHIAMVLNSLGGALLSKRQFDAAIAAYQRSLTIEEATMNQRGMAMVLNGLGGALQSKGLVDEAIAAYQRSLTLGEATSDQHHVAMVLNSLGGALQSRGQFDEAIAAYRRSLTIREASGEQWGIAAVLHSLGWVLQRKGLLDEALVAYRRSLAIGEATGDQRHVARVSKKLAFAQKYKDSLEKLMTSDDINAMSAIDHRRAGKQLMLQGDYAAALQHFLRALDLGIEAAQIGRLHAQAGNAAIGMKNYALALHHFQQAIARGEKNGFTYAHLARTLHQLGELPDVVEQHFLRALALDEKNAWASTWYSTLLKELGRLAEAEQYARRAVALRGQHALFLNNLALILTEYEDKPHLVEAVHYFELAVACAKPDFPYLQEDLQRVRARLAQSAAE